MKNSALRRLGVAALAAGVSVAVFSFSSSALADSASAPLALDAGGLQLQATSSSSLPDGYVLTTWQGSNLSVSAVALPGSTVDVTATAKSATVGIKPPPGASPTGLPQQAEATAYANALAVGFTPAQANADASQTANPLVADGGDTYDPCASVNGGPYNNTVHGNSCDNVVLVEAKPGQYWLTHEVVGSGYSNWECCAHALTQLNAWYSYPGESGDVRPDWEPQGTTSNPSGNPVTISLGFSYGGFSVGGSETLQGNSTFGPYFPNGGNPDPNLPAFGSIWDGAVYSGSNGNITYAGADATSLVHLGSGQNGDPEDHVGIGWN